MTTDLPTRFRPAALLAGPLALADLALLGGALATAGTGMLAIERSPLAVAASAAGLAALVLLVFAAVRLALLTPALQRGAGLLGIVVAIAGAVLSAGGQWTLVFVVPGLAEAAPEVAQSGLGSVTAGYVVSFLVFGVGWALVGATLLRAHTGPRWAAWVLLVGGLLVIVPAPARYVVVALGVSGLALRPAPATVPVPA